MQLVELEAGLSHHAHRCLLPRRRPDELTERGPEPRGCTAAPQWRPMSKAIEGRLMRSMKSILGSTLVEQSTDVGGGRPVRYLDVIAGYLRHLKQRAEPPAGHDR